MPYTLRPYQEEMVAAAMAAIPRDNFVLIQAATGAGKTIFFAELIRRLLAEWPSLRIGVLAHRAILIDQTRDKMMGVWPEAPIGVACSSTGIQVETDQPVVIGSVQTLVRRMDETPPFDIVVIDEAHRIPPRNHNSQYRKWLEKMLEYNSKTRILGVTATPFRLGHGYIYGDRCKSGNENWFHDLHYRIGINELQATGYLCQYRAKETVNISAELSKVHVSGEYNLGELSDMMSNAVHIGSAVKALQEYGYDREHVIVFGVTIDHVTVLSRAFNSAGVSATLIHSMQPKDEREAALEQFRSGLTRVICSVGVLTEGFDEPATDCIICCRPTKSAALHVQMCGRGLRPYTGKTDVLILDLANNFRHHGDINDPDISIPGKPPEKTIPPTKTCPKCAEVVPAGTRECPGCGYQWEAAQVEVIDDLPEMADVHLLKKDEAMEVIVVEKEVDYHVSKAFNKMVKIHLVCLPKGRTKLVRLNHFLMFEPNAHPYARRKAVSWWERMIPAPIPQSTQEAMMFEDDIIEAIPRKIKIMSDGKWWKVVDWMNDSSEEDKEIPF